MFPSTEKFIVNFKVYYPIKLDFWFQGAMYTFPSDEKRWFLPLGLGLDNCGLLSCIDELFFVFVSTHIFKKCFIEFDVMFQ